MKHIKFFTIMLIVFVFAANAISSEWRTYTKNNSGLSSDEVRAICIDSFGAKWFGTAGGLNRFDGDVWNTYTTEDKLAGNTVNTIAFEITSYGPEIWVGTDGGVSVISVVPDAVTIATPYTTENTGLISNMVTSAAVDTGHVKWFGTDKGISTFTGRVWASYTIENLLTNNNILAIAAAANGWLYFGTNGDGVNRCDGVSSASPYDTDWTSIGSNVVMAAHVASDGAKWFGTDNGVSRHIGNETKENWTTWTTAEGLSGNRVNAIAEDNSGRIWVGTDGGASMFDGETWKSLTVGDGLAGANVLSVGIDTNGSVWFGTDKGVSHYIPDGTSVAKDETMPQNFAISGIYPNPFNPTTTIEYMIPNAGFIDVAVYSMTGQKIRSLLSEHRSAGVHSIVWDGRDDHGMQVSAGVYISALRAGGMVTTGKMVLVK